MCLFMCHPHIALITEAFIIYIDSIFFSIIALTPAQIFLAILACSSIFLFYLFILASQLCMQDLSSWPGIKPVSPAVEVQSPNHWIIREFPILYEF